MMRSCASGIRFLAEPAFMFAAGGPDSANANASDSDSAGSISAATNSRPVLSNRRPFNDRKCDAACRDVKPLRPGGATRLRNFLQRTARGAGRDWNHRPRPFVPLLPGG